MALAAFRSRPCELPCSRCFAPLSPPPLSPVLRPPRVRALCGLRVLLPPAPTPSSPPRAADLTGPLPPSAPRGRGVFVRPHKAIFPRPRSAPFALPRFAPVAFPGRPLYSALCRCPRRLCLPSSALRVSAPCALPCVAFTRFCRPPPRPLAAPRGRPHGPPTRRPPQKGEGRLSAPTRLFSRARVLPLSPQPVCTGRFPRSPSVQRSLPLPRAVLPPRSPHSTSPAALPLAPASDGGGGGQKKKTPFSLREKEVL